MKKLLLMFCLLTSVFGFALESHAYVATFESLAHADAGFADHGAFYTEGGFQFTSIDPYEGGLPGLFSTAGTQMEGVYTTSTALLNNVYRGETVLTRVGGGTFNLNAITLAEMVAIGEPVQVLFTGSLASGTTVTQTFALDGIFGAENFSLNSNFSNLVSASWTQVGDGDFHQFDNVNVTPTPIPAAAWLLGSGLMGLVGVRRRNS